MTDFETKLSEIIDSIQALSIGAVSKDDLIDTREHYLEDIKELGINK